MLESLYIIGNGGNTLFIYSNIKSKHADDSELFSGVITAVQNMLQGINAGEVKKFTTSNYKVLLYPQKKYVYAFISNIELNIGEEDFDTLEVMLQKKLKKMLGKTKDIQKFVEANRDLLNYTVREALDNWTHKIQESKAVKKAKESLW